MRLVVPLVCALAAGSAPAAAQLPSAAELAARSAARWPQPVRVADLVGRSVLRHLESMPKLGTVRDVVAGPDGPVVVVDYGGVLGFGARPVAVPATAMALLGEYMEVLEYTPEQLDALPTFDPLSATPLPRDATIAVALSGPAH